MAKFDVDEMHVVEPRAVGADVHRMHLTASLRLCELGRPAVGCHFMPVNQSVFCRDYSEEFSSLSNWLDTVAKG